MSRIRKSAIAVVFCVCLGLPLSAIPQDKVAGCPEGMICLTKAQAAEVAQGIGQLDALLGQAAEMLERQGKELDAVRKKLWDCSTKSAPI